MKGVLMKLGQMASYVNQDLSPAARRTLSRLQDSAPPMSPELAAHMVTEELGRPPSGRSRPGIPNRSPPRRSGRCTGRSPTTAARWR